MLVKHLPGRVLGLRGFSILSGLGWRWGFGRAQKESGRSGLGRALFRSEGKSKIQSQGHPSFERSFSIFDDFFVSVLRISDFVRLLNLTYTSS